MTDQGYLHQRSDRFGKVPAEVMHDLSLTDGAVRLYAHMHWRYGANCDNHEGRSSMAEYLGVSSTTITHRVTELVRADWVIVVPNYNDQGRTANIYHVFELQEDCRRWRIDNNLPKPKAPAKRTKKSRKGQGGKPAHRLSEETQVNEPVCEPELTNQYVNLSSHDLDSIESNPIGLDLSSENSPLPDQPGYTWTICAGDNWQAHLVPTGKTKPICKVVPFQYPTTSITGNRKPCPECIKVVEKPPRSAVKDKQERKPRAPNVVLDAIATHLFGAKSRADINAVAVRAALILSGDSRRGCDGLLCYETERLGHEPDREQLAADVGLFWRNFKKHHPDLDLKDCQKFMEWWVKFRVAQAEREEKQEAGGAWFDDATGVWLRKVDGKLQQRDAYTAEWLEVAS
jgi:DNA-binding MarR family transcriptional regulator